MDELFSLHPNGVFLRREALAHGYEDRDLAEACRHGVLQRVRHGAYAPADACHRADEIGRHRLKAQAVLLTHDGRVALSHTSGAVEHGLRTWQPDLERVHVTRLDHVPGRREHDVVYHEGEWSPDDIYAKDELLLLGPETCALGAASLTTIEKGLVILDSVIDLGLGDVDTLWAVYDRKANHPGMRKVQVTLRLARPGAQSVGETLGRHLMWSQHLPAPVLQFEVRDHRGKLIGVADFAWPEFGLLGEFDGRIKYGRLLKPGEDAGDAVFREKQREDLLREITGWMMIRYIWADLFRPEITAARTRRLMRAAASA